MIDTKDISLFDEERIDITQEANFIWSIANKLRGVYMPDKYGDVIIPMTVLRRFECVLEKTKDEVIETYKKNSTYPAKAMYRISGKAFYNTSKYNLKELLNDPDHIEDNFISYIDSFSNNVQGIFQELKLKDHIKTMAKEHCLYNVVKAFSELDLSEENFPSIKMGYIFENLIGRFFQNVEAGQFYTGRDIIKMMVSVLTAEGSDDIYESGKVITILDQACGTGGMLSTAYSHIYRYNPSADIRLFGQEYMGPSYAVGLAEMLIKNQDAENFVRADTLKEDRFKEHKMRYVLENPPFGTPWKGADAKLGQEDAVLEEYGRGCISRWPAGLPAGGDSQLIFMQSAIDKMDENVGRAAIITNGSPLFNGSVSSGESQIRRWLLEEDLIEAIIAMPTDMFYNTGIATYVWILSKNKREERRGKLQLIDATEIYHTLRKSLGNKRKEFTKEDRERITELYTNFEETEISQIHPNEEFIYREYTVYQPLQRSYEISLDRVEALEASRSLASFFDPGKYMELSEKEKQGEKLKKAEKTQLNKFKENKMVYDELIASLKEKAGAEKYLSKEAFEPVLKNALKDVDINAQTFAKVLDGLSIMDKDAEVQKDKKGEIIYDKDTKDTELVGMDEDIDNYMAREVLPHVPDAKAFFEEDLKAKTPKIKTGAEIAFTRYFYKYEASRASEELAKEFLNLENGLNKMLREVFGDESHA
ncbi:type I restriction-modification system subunit M [Fenollaria massiliensis]|uniref:site-specific DNA-methyltransferase (adenine-specific) n=1 Tax=Fenollaria massiliensis TaxID=938288 RepID=A0A9E7DJA7_9FIRM|nr:class I SAM-dependent DNA methyltransferase [Fenollaria massiliensis]UQK58985.1 type I restriction-modification system subunit M [Fenollaria massiliensis]